MTDRCKRVLCLLSAASLASCSVAQPNPDLAHPVVSPAQPFRSDGTALDSVLARVRAETGLPALAAGAVCGDSIVAIGATGLRRVDGGQEVTLHDRFYVGSITKSMTATVLARLVERGLLSWETQVQDVFGGHAGRITPAFRGVTLRQLLSHRAGLPKFTDDEEFAPVPKTGSTPIEQRRGFVEWVLQQEPITEPGSAYEYSNAGYAVAVAMAEQVTGKPWEETMRELLFVPLGLTSAGFGPPALGDPAQPWGHTAEDGELRPSPPERKDAWQSMVLTGAGNVHMTIGDLTRYLGFHLRGLRGEPELLEGETFRTLHTPVAGSNYALGWAVDEVDGQPVSDHAGSDGTFRANVLVWPARNFAVAVATNAGGATEAYGAVARALLQRCPKPQSPVS